MSFRNTTMVIIVLVTVAAMAARMALAAEAPAAPASLPGVTTLSAAASTDAPPGPEPSPLETALPYVTEGGFFAIVGFALGYASRKLLKLALLLIAVLFVAIQGLSSLDVLTVDWDKAVALANELVLNVKQDQSWMEWVKDRLPTTGGLAAGYALGFRRG